MQYTTANLPSVDPASDGPNPSLEVAGFSVYLSSDIETSSE